LLRKSPPAAGGRRIFRTLELNSENLQNRREFKKIKIFLKI
jgi:hypothetical protein